MLKHLRVSVNAAPYVYMTFRCCFKVNGYTSMFSSHLTKVNKPHDFPFASSEDEPLVKGGLLLKERICS